MEVTQSNFLEVLEELDPILKNASFLAIDSEFTGINPGIRADIYDTPAVYYAKLRAGSMDFLLIQFGLSVFTYDKEKEKYLQRSYNFYVFPTLDRYIPNCQFMCQASAMAFLREKGFDFNKLFIEGIPYLTNVEEEKLKKRLKDRQKGKEGNPKPIIIKDADRPQIEEICSKIHEFSNSDEEELTIDRCNSFIWLIIQQELKKRWPHKFRLKERLSASHRSLVVQRIGSKEDKEKMEAERKEREQKDLKQAVGLSALLKKISDSGKLIVGHNMLFDLCHIVHQFFSPLPESYQEFKDLIHCLFPKLLDTKRMSEWPEFRESITSSELHFVYKTMSKLPSGIPEMDEVTGRSYSSLVDKSHEAGYDSYITGLCFVSLSNFLGSLQKPELSVVLPDSPLLNPFMNKLLITRLKEFSCIDLEGKDLIPTREHVFHITFPKEWQTKDIKKFFSDFGGVFVWWLSATTAYVGLESRDQVDAVNNHTFTAANFHIQKYSEHQSALEKKILWCHKVATDLANFELS